MKINKNTLYIIIAMVVIVSFLTIFGIVQYSTTSATFTGYGGVMPCDAGRYYSSYFYTYEEYKDYCEDYGVIVILSNYEGYSGTMYEARVQEVCYTCDNGETTVWVSSDECSYYDGELSDQDTLDYFYRGDDMSSYCEEPAPEPEPEEIICYECYDGRISSYVEEGTSCPSGWTSDRNSLDCSVGEDDEEQIEEINYVDCYQCQEGQVQTIEMIDGCANGWSETQPDCTIPEEETISCYECNGKVVEAYETTEECAPGWVEEVPECGKIGNQIEILFDFENNPKQAYILSGSILLLLASLIFLFTGKKEKNGVVVL